MSLFGRWFAKKESPAAEKVRGLIENAWEHATEPKGAAESARFGAELRERLILLIEKTETEIGQLALGFAEKEGVMMVHPKLLDQIRQQPDCAILEPALYLCFPTTDARRRVNAEWPSTVKRYRDKANTKDTLREKSLALAGFITNNLDVAASIYTESGGKITLDPTTPADELAEEQEMQARLEEAACWYRVIDELAFRYLGSDDRALFMDHLQDHLVHILALEGLPPDVICAVMYERTQEYGRYQRWVPEEGKGTKGTLLWEAAKHVGAPIGAGRHPVFLHAFGLGFLERLQQALVPELLTSGQK